MTPNPDFKVTPLFDAESFIISIIYLAIQMNISETARDRNSYNIILTGSYRHAVLKDVS